MGEPHVLALHRLIALHSYTLKRGHAREALFPGLIRCPRRHLSLLICRPRRPSLARMTPQEREAHLARLARKLADMENEIQVPAPPVLRVHYAIEASNRQLQSVPAKMSDLRVRTCHLAAAIHQMPSLAYIRRKT